MNNVDTTIGRQIIEDVKGNMANYDTVNDKLKEVHDDEDDESVDTYIATFQ